MPMQRHISGIESGEMKIRKTAQFEQASEPAGSVEIHGALFHQSGWRSSIDSRSVAGLPCPDSRRVDTPNFVTSIPGNKPTGDYRVSDEPCVGIRQHFPIFSFSQAFICSDEIAPFTVNESDWLPQLVGGCTVRSPIYAQSTDQTYDDIQGKRSGLLEVKRDTHRLGHSRRIPHRCNGSSFIGR